MSSENLSLPIIPQTSSINTADGKSLSFDLADSATESYSLTFPATNSSGMLINDGDGELTWDDSLTINNGKVSSTSFTSEYYHDIKDYMVPTQSDIFHEFSEQTILYPSIVSGGPEFGRATAISANGEYAACGAPYDDVKAGSNGAVYVFIRNNNTWTQQTILYPSVVSVGANFGYKVAISGDGKYIVCSAIGDNVKYTEAGAVYVFIRNNTTWTQQAILYPTSTTGAYFGYSISISADSSYILCGCSFDGLNYAEGLVYVFNRSGASWSLQTTLHPTTITGSPQFGQSVALSADGSYALCAAYADDVKASNAGAVYVFKRSNITWALQTILYSSITTGNPYLGGNVSISADGKYALCSTEGTQQQIYVFVRNENVWTEHAILTERITDPVSNIKLRQYTGSISADGRYIVCGAYLTSGGTGTGYIHIYVRNNTTWTLYAEIAPTYLPTNRNMGVLGVSISADGQYILAGAYTDSTAGASTGSVFVFNNSGTSSIPANLNIGGVLMIDGVQVVSAQDATIANATAITTVGANTGTSGAGLSLIGDTTFINQASNIMNDFKSLQEDVSELQTKLNLLLDALKVHGLIA